MQAISIALRAPHSEAQHSRQFAASKVPTTCRTSCTTCNLQHVCLPCGLSSQDTQFIDTLVYSRRHLRRGKALYEAGDPFHYIYAIRSGFFKGFILAEDGRDQVTGFQMAGDLMGLDGIESDRHKLSMVALEDSEICIIPFKHLEEMSGKVPHFQHQFHKMMSREIVREHGIMMLLGAMRAEERVATFLLDLSLRFSARGYSDTEFNLRMTREEIGSYLGLKLETVSRIFSRMQEQNLLSVRQRFITILDVPALKRVVSRAL